MRNAVLALSIAGVSLAISAQDQANSDEAHHASVQMHGDQAMGFSHENTTHHFRLSDSGGAIEVTANDPNDHADIDAIRMHLTHIATMFKNGDFSAPMFIHSTTPPGVPAMKQLRDKIQYDYEPIAAGGRVRIMSSDPVAVAAVQDFLRSQIADHKTGD